LRVTVIFIKHHRAVVASTTYEDNTYFPSIYCTYSANSIIKDLLLFFHFEQLWKCKKKGVVRIVIDV